MPSRGNRATGGEGGAIFVKGATIDATVTARSPSTGPRASARAVLGTGRSVSVTGARFSPYLVPGGLLNLGTATLTADDVSRNDPDDCAGSGTTTGC